MLCWHLRQGGFALAYEAQEFPSIAWRLGLEIEYGQYTAGQTQRGHLWGAPAFPVVLTVMGELGGPSPNRTRGISMKLKAIGTVLLLVVAVVLVMTPGTHAAPKAKATPVVTSQPIATTASSSDPTRKSARPSRLSAMPKNTWNMPPMISVATAWKRCARPTKPFGNWKFT